MDAVVTALKDQRCGGIADAFSNAFTLVYQNVGMYFQNSTIPLLISGRI